MGGTDPIVDIENGPMAKGGNLGTRMDGSDSIQDPVVSLVIHEELQDGNFNGDGDDDDVVVVGAILDEPKKKKKKTKRLKPPRPPKPKVISSLEAADRRLMREMTELAMLKRARFERMRALKDVKNAKEQSANSHASFWVSLFITALFCIVMFWHGFCSKGNSTRTSEVVPISSLRRGGLMSVQYFMNNLSSKPDITSSSAFFSKVSESRNV